MTAGTIDRRSGLSHREFVREYLSPLKPVILTDAIGNWGATGTWTPQFFKEQYGTHQIVVDGQSYTVARFIDDVIASTPDRPAPYLRNSLVDDWPGSVKAAISPLPWCTKPNWFDSRWFPSKQSHTFVELYIGGAGAKFPVLHYDGLHTHAFLMQLYGRKQYIVFSPEQSPYMYPSTGGGSSNSLVDDVLKPDLTRFPLFAKAVPTVFELGPGETLFVPSGWWHTARILSPSITVSANTANGANWKAFSADFVAQAVRHRSRLRAAVLAAYLPLFGVAQSLFDLFT